MVNARAKGQRGEREVVGILQPVVNKVYGAHGMEAPNLERNLMQSARGGYDIIGLEWLALEVKRREQVMASGIMGWWNQTKEQAMANQEPVLFYRHNGVSWNVMMYGYLCVGQNGGMRVRGPVVVNLPHFVAWFELRIIHELKSRHL